jgi:hypothetical protein
MINFSSQTRTLPSGSQKKERYEERNQVREERRRREKTKEKMKAFIYQEWYRILSGDDEGGVTDPEALTPAEGTAYAFQVCHHVPCKEIESDQDQHSSEK